MHHDFDLKILLIIPCYNESQNIETLLNKIRSLNYSLDVLVIDDGSIDQTYERASKLVPCLRLSSNLGIGGAVQAGIKYAVEKNYDAAIQVDGDGQHPPDQIPMFVEELHKSGSNLIIGSRFLGAQSFQSTFLRRQGIRIISKTIRLFFGYFISDPTSGFRLYDRSALSLFYQRYPHDYPEPISIAYAIENNLKISEIPVRMEERLHGFSSIAGLKTLLYMIRVVAYLILIRFGRYIQ